MRVRLDEESLKRVAEITQGEYFYAGTAVDLKKIYESLTAKIAFEKKQTEITALFAAGLDAGIDYVLPGALYLRGATKPAFFDFIKTSYPEKYDTLWNLYKKGGAPKEYKDELYGRLNPLRQSFGLSNSYSKPIKAKLKVYPPSEEQVSFLTPS